MASKTVHESLPRSPGRATDMGMAATGTPPREITMSERSITAAVTGACASAWGWMGFSNGLSISKGITLGTRNPVPASGAILTLSFTLRRNDSSQ